MWWGRGGGLGLRLCGGKGGGGLGGSRWGLPPSRCEYLPRSSSAVVAAVAAVETVVAMEAAAAVTAAAAAMRGWKGGSSVTENKKNPFS